jgi:carbonic anhydrase/acetyltransferase-like protein (isoleucine patch superfamily)
MLLEHGGKSPKVHPTAYVAPNAVLCGDVTVGPDCRIMFGAQVIAEGTSIELGERCIVLENAVLRATAQHRLTIGKYCLIGPNAHVVGCTVEDEVFIATGASVFHGARLGKGAEVRINAVVHLKTELLAGTTVPIGWIAVGAPAQIFAPAQHERIWELQKPLDFPLAVYGLERGEADMLGVTDVMAVRLGSHSDDKRLDD